MRKIGRYEIVEKIGEGGMGTVYKAVLPTLNRTVALKVLSDACAKDEEILQRFLREARVMAGLSDYTHVVQVFDLDEYQGGYFYTMEFIPNSLAHQLGEAPHVEDKTRRVKTPKKKLAVPTAVKIAEHLLKGLKGRQNDLFRGKLMQSEWTYAIRMHEAQRRRGRRRYRYIRLWTFT